ncbi:MAG: protein kinase [Pseudolysinimonas sp.]
MNARDAQPSPRELGPRQLAGFRVLRSLARDEQAEVLLGHRSVPASSNDGGEVAVQTVAIKVSPASELTWQTALRECAGLERARGEHVVDVLDLDADDESIRVIFERLPRGDLSDLLRVRVRLDAGEAVTILAPIAVTLLRMHAAGVAHGKLAARTVLFRDDGAPALIGFSCAELFEPGAPEVVLERVGAVGRDRAAARALAIAVLGRVDGGQARAARALLDDIAGCDDGIILPLLASRLFDVAAAVPVRFAPDAPGVDSAHSAPRALPVAEGMVGATVDPTSRFSSHLVAALGRIVPEPLLQRVLDAVERSPVVAVLAPARESVQRLWVSWQPGRRRAVLAAGAALLTVGVVTMVVPSGAAASGVVGGAGSRVGTPTGDPTTRAPTVADGSQRDEPALTADDPVAATGLLVTARDRCLRSLSVPCLDRVDEPSSGALKDDQMAIRTAQQGAELPDPLTATGEGAPVLIERLGDSALVRLGAGASAPTLLLVKGEAGWRVRDVIVAGGRQGPTASRREVLPAARCRACRRSRRSRGGP